MRKSAKFTAAQNKEQKADFIDSLGEMVAYCEKYGGVIPRHEIKADADIVDTVIRDLKAYTKSLIYEDKALAKQIEDYLKKKEIAEQMKKDRLESKGKEVEVEDEDIVKNLDRIEEEKAQDQEIYNTEVEDIE